MFCSTRLVWLWRLLFTQYIQIHPSNAFSTFLKTKCNYYKFMNKQKFGIWIHFSKIVEMMAKKGCLNYISNAVSPYSIENTMCKRPIFVVVSFNHYQKMHAISTLECIGIYLALTIIIRCIIITIKSIFSLQLKNASLEQKLMYARLVIEIYSIMERWIMWSSFLNTQNYGQMIPIHST